MRRARAEFYLFAISLAALLALCAWWSVAMSRAVDQSYAYRLEELTGAAAALGSAARAELESWYFRRRLMVFGEGGLLMILTAVCCLMLFRLAAEQRRFREQLEAFVGQATHEMKTPLAGLRALLETVNLGRMPAEQMGEAVALGLRQIDRQERLIQNLLMGHRLRFAEGDFKVQPTLLAPLVERLLRERTGVGDRGCDFVFEGPSGLEALADSEAVQTILENLLENAVIYGAKSVRVVGAQDGEGVRLTVEDDGNGFASDQSEALFQPYIRGESDTRGTGLGLPLSRSLAEAMQGQLMGSSSGKGKGATFVLNLQVVSGDSV
jgi:signal transduction histidine kinase